MSEMFLTIGEVAKIVKKDRRVVRRWIEEGYLVAMPPHVFGAHYPRVSRAALDEFQRMGLEAKPESPAVAS